MTEYFPGDQCLLMGGGVNVKIVYMAKIDDRLWFSCGLSFPVDYNGLFKIGITYEDLALVPAVWAALANGDKVGHLETCKPGEVILVVTKNRKMMKTDIVMMVDSQTKLIYTASGRVLGFNNNEVLKSGTMVPLNDIEVSRKFEAIRHQMYP